MSDKEKKELLSASEAEGDFGFDPRKIGNRHRGWWIVGEIEEEESKTGAQIGDLCIKSRDGSSNPIDTAAIRRPNFVGTSTDEFDPTYRYYYYRNLSPQEMEGGAA